MQDPNKIYDDQLKAITNIAHTDWYKEIKSFWKRELDSIKSLFPQVKEENLYKLQERYLIADKFLTFLNNLESAQDITQQAKV